MREVANYVGVSYIAYITYAHPSAVFDTFVAFVFLASIPHLAQRGSFV